MYPDKSYRIQRELHEKITNNNRMEQITNKRNEQNKTKNNKQIKQKQN